MMQQVQQKNKAIMGTTKNDRIKVFLDIQETIKTNPKLSELTEIAVRDTTLYYEDFTASKKASHDNCFISVVEDLSFEAALILSIDHDRIAVLNFASAVNPGGGVTIGADAQEEYLCRGSNLYNCLTRQDLFENFYQFHRSLNNTLYSDRVIYSKRVVVFETNSSQEHTDKWLKVDIITSSAPNLRNGMEIDTDELAALFRKRIKNILEIAAENGNEALVLGAYGCGAFRNPPEIVAEAFRTVLLDWGYNKYFKTVVFAIKRSNVSYCPNLAAFEEAFHGISEGGNKRRFF